MNSRSKKDTQKSDRKGKSRPEKQKRAATSKLAQLERKIETLQDELAEGQLRENATSEILRVIASSPSDVGSVLNAIAERATRLCNAKDAVIRLIEGSVLRFAAHHGSIPFFGASEIPINRGSVTGRAVVDGQSIHVVDLMSLGPTEFPEIWTGVDDMAIEPNLLFH